MPLWSSEQDRELRSLLSSYGEQSMPRYVPSKLARVTSRLLRVAEALQKRSAEKGEEPSQAVVAFAEAGRPLVVWLADEGLSYPDRRKVLAELYSRLERFVRFIEGAGIELEPESTQRLEPRSAP